MGKSDSSYKLATERETWRIANDCLSAGDEPTALAVTERTFQTVNAAIIAGVSGDEKISFYGLPQGANSVRITAVGITNDGTYTVDIYSGVLDSTVDNAKKRSRDCNLTFVCTLAFIIGQQTAVLPDDSTGYEMAQSVGVTTGDWTGTIISEGTVDSDRTCEVRFDEFGDDVLVIVPTTCSANSMLLIKGY